MEELRNFKPGEGLKIIKQGQTTFAPYNRETVQYFQEWNDLIRRRTPQFAEKEMVTLLKASKEEMAEYMMPKIKERPKSVKLSQADENAALREQMAQMQQQMIMMQGLLLQKSQSDSPEGDQPKRAGRPPKAKEDEKEQQ